MTVVPAPLAFPPGPAGRLRGLAAFVLSFESAFVCFLFAGVLKGQSALAWLPVDFTLLMLLLVAAAGGRSFFFSRWTPPSDLLLLAAGGLLLAGYAGLSLVWSPGEVYARDKALRLAVLCLAALLGGALVSGVRRDRCWRLLWLVVALAAALAGEFLLLQRTDPVRAEQLMGADYIGLGRLFGCGFLVLAGSLLWMRAGLLSVLLRTALAVLLLVGLLSTGGRGPLLSVGAVLLLVLVRDVRLGPGYLRLRRPLVLAGAGLGLLVTSLVVLGRSQVLLRTLDRLAVLFSGGGGRSAQERLWFFEQAWRQWQDAPLFGHGLGSFPVLQGWPDFRAYPHNIVLELLVELGLVGLCLFGFLIFLALRRLDLARLREDPQLSIVALLAGGSLLNALVSGDLADNKLLFGLIGLLAGLNRCGRTASLPDGRPGAPKGQAA